MHCHTVTPPCFCSYCSDSPWSSFIYFIPHDAASSSFGWTVSIFSPPEPSLPQTLALWPPSCSVLVATRLSGPGAAVPEDGLQLFVKGNRLVKMAVWGLSATLGAAVFAVAQTAMEWGPEALLQLFWLSGGKWPLFDSETHLCDICQTTIYKCGCSQSLRPHLGAKQHVYFALCTVFSIFRSTNGWNWPQQTQQYHKSRER